MTSYFVGKNDDGDFEVTDGNGDLVDTSGEDEYLFVGGIEGHSYQIERTSTSSGYIYVSFDFLSLEDAYGLAYIGEDDSDSKRMLSTGPQSFSNEYVVRFDALDSDTEDLGYFYSNIYADLDGTEWAYFVKVVYWDDCPDISPYVLTAEQSFTHEEDDDSCWTTGTVNVGREDGRAFLFQAANTTRTTQYEHRIVYEGATIYAGFGITDVSLFTGDITVDLISGGYTLTNVEAGDYTISGQEVTFTSMKVNTSSLRFGIEFEMPTEASGLHVDLSDNTQSGALVFNADGSTEIVEDFTYEAPETELFFNMLGIFSVTAKDMSVTYKAGLDALQFHAAIEFEADSFVKYGVDKITADLTDTNYLQVDTDGNVELIGSIKAEGKVELGKGFELTGLEFSIDTVNQLVAGTATLTTPFGLKVSKDTSTAVTLGFHYDPLELDRVAVNVTGLNYAMPVLPFFILQDISGELKNFAPSNVEDDSAKFTIAFTLGPSINDSSISRMEIDAEVTESYIQGTLRNTALTVNLAYEIYGWNVDLGSHSLMDWTAIAKLDWAKGELSETGEGSFVGGIATFSGGVKIGTDYSHSWVLDAQLNVADIVPFWGGTSLLQGTLKKIYINDDTQENDYISVTARVNLLPATEEGYWVQVGLKYTEGSGFSLIWGDEIPITSSWYISAGRNFIMLASTWETETEGVEVYVTAPDGTVYYEDQFAANGITVVEDFTTNRSRAVVIDSPMEGTWDVEVVDATGLGEVNHFAVGEDLPPELVFDGVVQQDSETVEIDFTVSGLLDYQDANVLFFYDDDLTELDGLYIDNTDVENGSESYTWDPSGVVPGDYYIYGVVTYGDGLTATYTDDTLLHIGSEADIGVELSVSETDLVVGDTVTLTVTFTNNSTDTDSEDINLALGVPAGLDYKVGNSQQTLSEISIAVAALAAGATYSEELTFVVTDDLAAGDVATFSSYLTTGIYDPDSSNNRPAVSVSIVEPEVEEEPAPDLELTTDFGDLTDVAPGDRLTWTASLTNIGTENSQGYTFDLYAPTFASLSVVRLSENGEYTVDTDYEYTSYGLTFTTTKDLDVGETDVLIFSAIVGAEGANYVSMIATEQEDADPDTSNNEAYAALDALDVSLPTADLSLEWASELPEDGETGERLITLYITADGEEVGTQVEVQLDLPDGVEVISASPEMGTYDAQTGIWSVGNFLGYNYPALELVVSGSGTQEFTAEVIDAAYADPDSTFGDGAGDDYATLSVDFDDETDLTGPYYYRHPDIVATNLVVESVWQDDLPVSGLTLAPDETLRLSWTVENIGGDTSNTSYSGAYLSTDMTFSIDDDTRLKFTSSSALEPGETENESFRIALPEDLTTGTYYIAIIADYRDGTAEGDETNNVSEIVELTVVGNDPDPAADLQVTDISLDATDLEPGDTLNLSWELSNTGDGDAEGSSYSVILSSDQDISPDDDTVLFTGNAAGLFSGNAANLSETLTLPDTLDDGTYYIAVLADSDEEVEESDEANNTSTPVQITVTTPVLYPDLSVTDISLATTDLEPGGTLDLSWELSNSGDGGAAGSSYSVILSSDQDISLEDDTVLATGGATALAAGGMASLSETLSLPDDLAAGTYYIAVLADSDDAIEEWDETNNLSATLQVTVAPADLIINGTTGDDDLDGGDGDDTIQALAGDDVVTGGAGADDITLGEGQDVVEDVLENLDGDVIQDFGPDDALHILGDQVARDAIVLTPNGTSSATLTIDADQDGSPEASVQLQGDFTGGDIVVVYEDGGTTVRYADYLIELTERQSVSGDAINGVVLPEVLNGENVSGLTVTIGEDSQSLRRNSIGTYEIDEDGNLSNVTILALNTHQAQDSMELSISDPDNDLGFFMIKNGAWQLRGLDANSDAFEFVSDGMGGYDLALDGDVLDVDVYFSHDASLNPDGMEHVVSGLADDGSGALVIGFEDSPRDRWFSDDDFQDVLLYVA